MQQHFPLCTGVLPSSFWPDGGLLPSTALNRSTPRFSTTATSIVGLLERSLSSDCLYSHHQLIHKAGLLGDPLQQGLQCLQLFVLQCVYTREGTCCNRTISLLFEFVTVCDRVSLSLFFFFFFFFTPSSGRNWEQIAGDCILTSPHTRHTLYWTKP